MADILQITEDIPVDDSIYEYEYKEYNPIVGTNLNRGSIVLTIESQDIYTHPAESFLVIEGRLIKLAVGPGGADVPYDEDAVISLINNGMSSVYLGPLGQPFYPIYHNFFFLNQHQDHFSNHLKNLKQHRYIMQLLHHHHHHMIYP